MGIIKCYNYQIKNLSIGNRKKIRFISTIIIECNVSIIYYLVYRYIITYIIDTYSVCYIRVINNDNLIHLN